MQHKWGWVLSADSCAWLHVCISPLDLFQSHIPSTCVIPSGMSAVPPINKVTHFWAIYGLNWVMCGKRNHVFITSEVEFHTVVNARTQPNSHPREGKPWHQQRNLTWGGSFTADVSRCKALQLVGHVRPSHCEKICAKTSGVQKIK